MPAELADIVLQLGEPWLEGDWFEAIVRPYLSSPFITPVLLGGMVWFAIGVSFYVYGDGLALPLAMTILFGGAIVVAAPAIFAEVAMFAAIVAVAVIGTLVVWRLYRR